MLLTDRLTVRAFLTEPDCGIKEITMSFIADGKCTTDYNEIRTRTKLENQSPVNLNLRTPSVIQGSM